MATVGSTLYGTTNLASAAFGTLFSINTNGTGFQVLHNFSANGGDGRSPQAGLAVDGSTLFGTTSSGGSLGGGTVFSINTDGSAYQVLYSFSGAVDGVNPNTGLTLSGSTLFGTTIHGGVGNGGTVFSMHTDGTGFQVLHSLNGPTTVGTGPAGDLTISGSILYGTTVGSNTPGDNGTVFAMNTDGTGFRVLHTFAGGPADGMEPVGGLTLIGSTLVGITKGGDPLGRGAIFALNTDGSGYQLLHTFAGGAADGQFSATSLTLIGSTLFGTTQSGGSSNRGTVFALVVPEPSSLLLGAIGCTILVLVAYRRRNNA